MIDLNKIVKNIKKRLIWFVTTNYGRFALGIILAITGVFTQYSTIDFLSTDWLLFEITATLGVLIITGQFLWVVIGSLYLYFNNKS